MGGHSGQYRRTRSGWLDGLPNSAALRALPPLIAGSAPEFSIAAGRGGGCRAKIRKAAKAADLSAWTPGQLEDARLAIADTAVVPADRPMPLRQVPRGSEALRVMPTKINYSKCLSFRSL
jgi:hypothetical protein